MGAKGGRTLTLLLMVVALHIVLRARVAVQLPVSPSD